MAQSAKPPSFLPLRYDEDYSYLSDPALRHTRWDELKYIPLTGNHRYVSLGGEARARFESYRNENFTHDPAGDNSYLMQRYLLHADAHLTDRMRLFGQLGWSLEDGRDAGPRPTDRNGTDIHQLFVDIGSSGKANSNWLLRLGRQELSYGTERLVSVREGTNSRRALDSLRLIHRTPGWRVDMFFGRPVEVDKGAFDDDPIDDYRFWGVYAVVAAQPATLDFYYLGTDNPRAVFSQGAGRDRRHTFGTRASGNAGRWDFNNEAVLQLGKFGDTSIFAWSVATEHGYTIESAFGRPRIGLRAAIGSGDRNVADDQINTLNPLFPRANYFTESTLVGPANFIDIHPTLRMQLHPAWSVEAGVDWYWRQQLEDGLYNGAGGLIYRGSPGFSRRVGTDASLTTTVRFNRHALCAMSYSHFFAGPFIDGNGGVDADFVAAWLTLVF